MKKAYLEKMKEQILKSSLTVSYIEGREDE